MSLKLYRITPNEILEVKKFSPQHLVLLTDEESKKIFVYRGPDCLSLNEFESSVLYERILQRFLNSNIFLITTLAIHADDSEEISSIKSALHHYQVNLLPYNISKYLKRLFLFQGLRDRITEFKNYENSRVWRQKLTNLSSMWKLSIFNVIGLAVIILLLGLKLGVDIIPAIKNEFANLHWMENLVIFLIFSLIILGIILLINLAFILFPMKFPIKPSDLKEMKADKLQPKMNPKE